MSNKVPNQNKTIKILITQYEVQMTQNFLKFASFVSREQTSDLQKFVMHISMHKCKVLVPLYSLKSFRLKSKSALSNLNLSLLIIQLLQNMQLLVQTL